MKRDLIGAVFCFLLGAIFFFAEAKGDRIGLGKILAVAKWVPLLVAVVLLVKWFVTK